MLSRPVPRYPHYVSQQPTATLPSPLPLQATSMDPSSVDFRAFYPYTPNEVKHRKRTTTTQLRTLEAIFKRDTKPNGPLRVELAAQLGMTARGVQVWFQNRRAKEKIKANKVAKSEQPDSADILDSTESLTEHSPIEGKPFDKSHISQTQQTSASPPPSLQLVTDSTKSQWAETPIDPHSLHVDPNLHAYRRGSLPANAFPTPNLSSNSPPHLDSFDPLTRRRSVDVNLQRLANNPYAPLARAKNDAIYGLRAIPSIRRQLGRAPYAPPSRIASSASMPYRTDVRRASLGNFRLSPQYTASPSPSPLSPYHGVRASLPDQNLYAVSSRPMPSPIPGPLPSPNFSFGAANTPSMTSGSSADSERNSPDSAQCFAPREYELDEDDGTPASYYSRSRVGSITSIATSDSSINSTYYPDVAACYPEHDQDFTRRDSCTSVHFASLMSGLDVSGTREPTGSPRHSVYTLHEDTQDAAVVAVSGNGSCVETNTYPSPTSTISPGPSGSPHSQGTPPSVPISTSSELSHALQNPSEVVQHNINSSSNNVMDDRSFTAHIVITPEVNPSGETYLHTLDASHQQATTPAQSAMDFAKQYSYDPSSVYLTENYALLEGETDIGLHHQNFESVNPALFDTMAPSLDTAQTVDHYYS